MGFVKVVKNKSYFKRFQVKYRRRREGKTDYFARKRLVVQDKDKYASPKYRLVARFTNKDVIAQIVYVTADHDEVMCASYAHELKKFGIASGLTNYAAAYCTGLLLARRLLRKLKLDSEFVGNEDVNGEHYLVTEGESVRPFKAVLDVGVARTTTGARVFAVMKGVCDGGIFVPHSDSGRRFPGYDKETGEFDASVLRKYIFGGHVADYMNLLKDQNEEKYQRQFSEFIKAGVEPDALEEMYANAHSKIREDPERKPAPKKEIPAEKRKRFNRAKLNAKSRKNRVKQIKQNIAKKVFDE